MTDKATNKRIKELGVKMRNKIRSMAAPNSFDVLHRTPAPHSLEEVHQALEKVWNDSIKPNLKKMDIETRTVLKNIETNMQNIKYRYDNTDFSKAAKSAASKTKEAATLAKHLIVDTAGALALQEVAKGFKELGEKATLLGKKHPILQKFGKLLIKAGELVTAIAKNVKTEVSKTWEGFKKSAKDLSATVKSAAKPGKNGPSR